MIEVTITDRQKQFACAEWSFNNLSRQDVWFERISSMGNIPNDSTVWVWHFRHPHDATICSLRFL